MEEAPPLKVARTSDQQSASADKMAGSSSGTGSASAAALAKKPSSVGAAVAAVESGGPAEVDGSSASVLFLAMSSNSLFCRAAESHTTITRLFVYPCVQYCLHSTCSRYVVHGSGAAVHCVSVKFDGPVDREMDLIQC